MCLYCMYGWLKRDACTHSPFYFKNSPYLPPSLHVHTHAQGEEENSSEGFRETVLQNLHWYVFIVVGLGGVYV